VRAIIIDDKDARALLDRLKLESFEKSLGGYGVNEHEAWHGLPLSMREEIIRRIHGRFHYVVCDWLQDQGAKVVRG
jgi:hypothetical protein